MIQDTGVEPSIAGIKETNNIRSVQETLGNLFSQAILRTMTFISLLYYVLCYISLLIIIRSS